MTNAVKEEPSKHRGGGGSGDLEKRVTAIEARLGVIEKTMVTGEMLQRELGNVRAEIGSVRTEILTEIGGLRVEISKVPFETLKWFVLSAGTVAAIVFGYYNTFIR